MKKNIISYDDVARESLCIGVNKVANAVKVTMGAKGKKVIAEREYATPVSTNDGVTVARGIELHNSQENQGCLLTKEAADKTNEDTGDGTTTVVLLIQAIVNEGIRNITAGNNSQDIVTGMEKATDFIVEQLRKNSRKVKTRLQKEQVAIISAGNATWGKNIVDAMEIVGPNGVVTVGEGSRSETTIDTIQGMQFENGFLSPYFITKLSRMECVLNDPFIVIIDREINSIKELAPICEKIISTGKPCLFIVNDMGPDVLVTLLVNKRSGKFLNCVVKGPAVGYRRLDELSDIAVLTGGKVLSEEIGIDMAKVELKDLGRCKQIVINKDYTTMMGGVATKAAVDGKVRELRKQIEDAVNDYDKIKYRDRIAKLTGGMAQILIGAATESEMKADFYKYEDALHATKAAIQEGIVPGGGVAYLDCLKSLDDLKVSKEEQVGVDIIKEAIKKPIIQICDNAGQEGKTIMLEAIKRGKGTGYDVMDNNYKNMLKSGIIDPVKVTRLALQNAVSISKTILNCGALIVDIPEETDFDKIPTPGKSRNPEKEVW